MSAVGDAEQAAIRAAYNELIEARDLAPRWGQRQMIAEVANTLARIDAAEGPSDPPAVAVIIIHTGKQPINTMMVGNNWIPRKSTSGYNTPLDFCRST